LLILTVSCAIDRNPWESQRKFVSLALDLGHRLGQFTIVKVPKTI
jgi:hypothetical protein